MNVIKDQNGAFLFEINGETFEINADYSGCYGMYWNRGTMMKHSYIEPEDFSPDSIGEEWRYLETPDYFASFVMNLPNAGGYAPQNWQHNKKFFIEHEAKQVTE